MNIIPVMLLLVGQTGVSASGWAGHEDPKVAPRPVQSAPDVPFPNNDIKSLAVPPKPFPPVNPVDPKQVLPDSLIGPKVEPEKEPQPEAPKAKPKKTYPDDPRPMWRKTAKGDYWYGTMKDNLIHRSPLPVPKAKPKPAVQPQVQTQPQWQPLMTYPSFMGPQQEMMGGGWHSVPSGGFRGCGPGGCN